MEAAIGLRPGREKVLSNYGGNEKKCLFSGKGTAVRSQVGSWKHIRSAWLEHCMKGLDTERRD